MATDKKVSLASSQPDGAASHAEIETLLGTARAAVTEITSLQQAAARAATDAELERAKAVEHLTEVEAKREAAATAETAIKALAEKSAKVSSDIDDGVKFAVSSKETIAGAVNESSAGVNQVNECATKAIELLTSSSALLDEVTQKGAATETLIAQIAEDSTKAKELIATAESAQTEAIAARDSAKANADLSATECRNVQDGRNFIEEHQTRAEQFANDTKTKLDEAISSATAIQDALTKVTEDNDKAGTTLDEIIGIAARVEEAKLAAQEDQKATAELAKIANSIKERVQAYENNLKTMSGHFEELNSKIESLLPGATSAGLAAAFHAQKDKYVRPKSWWNTLFIFAIAGLAAIGIAEFAHHFSNATPNYDELFRSFLTRITVVIALVWLALHASGKSRIANQIQEDYTYKEAVSRSFEGYKKEFASLPDHVTAASPLGTLCQSMVTILASSPSRVYDKHANDPTPMSTLNETVKQLSELVKEAKSIKPKIEVTAGMSDDK
jgi:hypothetical protein